MLRFIFKSPYNFVKPYSELLSVFQYQNRMQAIYARILYLFLLRCKKRICKYIFEKVYTYIYTFKFVVSQKWPVLTTGSPI